MTLHTAWKFQAVPICLFVKMVGQKYSLNFVVVLVQNAQVTFCWEILPLLASFSILNVVSHLRPVCFLSGFGLI
jgi:hypothetical protein